jgi:hypothetical protein
MSGKKACRSAHRTGNPPDAHGRRGINVHNAPWQQDASLAETTTRLADLSAIVPNLDALAVIVLDALAHAHHAMLEEGLDSAIRDSITIGQLAKLKSLP